MLQNSFFIERDRPRWAAQRVTVLASGPVPRRADPSSVSSESERNNSLITFPPPPAWLPASPSEKKIVILAGLISLSILPECPRRRPNSSGYRRSSSQAAGAQVGGRVSLVISLVVLSPTFRTCSRTITVGSVAARRMTLMLDSIKPASAFFYGLEKLDISGFRLWFSSVGTARLSHL